MSIASASSATIAARGGVEDPWSLGLLREVAAHAAGVSPEDIAGPSRGKHAIVARHTFMWLACRLTNCSLKRIAQAAGWNNHTTTLHALWKCRDIASRNRIALDMDEPHEAAEQMAKLLGARNSAKARPSA